MARLEAALLRSEDQTARFYTDYVLSQASGLSHSILHGAAGALAEGVL